MLPRPPYLPAQQKAEDWWRFGWIVKPLQKIKLPGVKAGDWSDPKQEMDELKREVSFNLFGCSPVGRGKANVLPLLDANKIAAKSTPAQRGHLAFRKHSSISRRGDDSSRF